MSSQIPHITPDALNEIRTLDDVLAFLAAELDWPIDATDLEDASFDFSPSDLGIKPERVPRLVSIRQLQPLTAGQPWGIFFLEFEGPRLPITPLRQLLRALVNRKRAGASGNVRTWALKDLLFVITTTDQSGVELHLVAFDTTDADRVEIFSLPWRPGQSPPQHLRRLAHELLPRLAWPTDPTDVNGWRAAWHEAFALRPGGAIASARQLADRMALTAHVVRVQITAILADADGNEPLEQLLDEVREQLLPQLDAEQFADMCAQTLVYGLLSSRITDPIGFGASPVLAVVPLSNPFLDAFFERVHDRLYDSGSSGNNLEGLVADLRATNVEAILDQFGATARGADPVVHFYEEFLKVYDAEIRAEAGAFYTPQPVVQYMVRSVDELLKTHLGLSNGVADNTTWAKLSAELSFAIPDGVDPQSPFLSVIDPATGTGTFLVEWIRQAHSSFLSGGRSNGDGWREHLDSVVLPSLTAFELGLGLPRFGGHLQ